MKIQFITAWNGHEYGDIVDFGDTENSRLISSNIAINYINPSSGATGSNEYGAVFNPIISLDKPERYYSDTPVTGALSFSLAESPLTGSNVLAPLIANGANAPVFLAPLLQHNSDAGYDNRVGILNLVRFWYDGARAWYSISHQVGATPAPSLLSATIENAATTEIRLTYNQTLNTTPPVTSAFTITASGGAASVNSVSIATTVVTVTASRAFVAGEVVSISYTVPGANEIKNTSGGLASALVNQSVTNNISAIQFPRLASGIGLTESGNGTTGWTYTGGAGAWAAQHMLTDRKFPSGGNAQVQARVTANPATNSAMLGLNSANADVDFTGYEYGVFLSTLPGAGVTNYYTITNGAATDRGVTGVINDYIRLRRTGTSIVAEKSTDNSNWTTIFTWTGASTADLWVMGGANLAGVLTQINGTGLV